MPLRRVALASSVPTLALLAGFFTALAAHAQEVAVPPVYLATMTRFDRPDRKPEVKFVFAKPKGDGRFTLTQGYTVEVAGHDACEVRPTTNLRMPDRYLERPLYDPADARSRLAAGEDLPGFFARAVVAQLSKPGFDFSMAELKPYYACTRAMWEELLKQMGAPAGPAR
jgi:hypothetical protein